MRFDTTAIAAATAYYDYLAKDSKSKGVSVVKVQDIEFEGKDVTLWLDKKIMNADGITLVVTETNGEHTERKEYTAPTFVPMTTGKRSKYLTIRPTESFCKVLMQHTADQITIESDLKFLVKRVEEWYQKYGDRVEIPTTLPKLKCTPEILLGKKPSEDQCKAIKTVFSTPFSYVWGAPGTGKTQMVLAQCVLQYIREGRKVLVTAPTNNALEQTLYGLLPVLEQTGYMHNTKIVRLGVPNEDFAERFGNVCESSVVESLKQQINEQIAQIDGELSDLRDRIDILTQHDPDELIRKATAVRTPIKIKFQIISNLEKDAETIQNQILGWERQIEYTHVPFLKSRLQKMVDKAKQNLSGIQNKIDVLYSEIMKQASFDDVLTYCLQQMKKDRYGEVDTVFDEYLEKKRNKLNETDEREIRTIRKRISELQKQQSQLKERQQKSDDSVNEITPLLDDMQLVAATLDTCIKRVLPDGGFMPDHVFLDEAGYCSLIKGMTLSAYEAPVTYLGDHMQLPPVCEMGKKEMERHKEVVLWAQSTLFAEHCNTSTINDLYNLYDKEETPVFRSLKKASLQRTHRFGPELADILANEVYTDGFSGNPEATTELLYINAPASPEKKMKDRVSEAEVNAIRDYCMLHCDENIGIITPYKNQVDKLRQALKVLLEDATDTVMTVHGSQGREWDTVILSVVDTSDHFFTDSTHSQGKKVINTAVSRAKKRLIIVCDAQYWKNAKNQLISKILHVSEEETVSLETILPPIENKDRNEHKKDKAEKKKTDDQKTNTNDYRRPVPVGERFTGPGSFWTQSEADQLLAEMQQGLPIKTIAAIHDRTEGAIKSQLKRIENGWTAVTWEVRPERHGAPWLQEEKDDVRNEYENGIAIEQIAESHQRSPEAIRKNLIVQGLIEN